MPQRTLVFGTRGSQLALAQTRQIITKVQRLHPELQCEIEIISTTGDRLLETPLAQMSGKGVFVNEIENALLNGNIDVAVHSLKDLPTVQPERLEVAVIPERADARDVLYAPKFDNLSALPEGAVIGTSSTRRAAQLRLLRGDFVIRDIRGNVDTRMRKVDEGTYDATVLAAAGLYRLGLLLKISDFFDIEQILPAPAQGALAIEIRKNDNKTRTLLAPLDDADTHAAVVAERVVLQTLGGGCAVPVAAFARPHETGLHLQAAVIAPDGKRVARASAHGKMTEAKALGERVAQLLIDDGAAAILHAFNKHIAQHE